MYSFVREVRITDTYKISYSYEILIKVAEWLIKKDKLRGEDCPIVVTNNKTYSINTRKRYLINTQPKHRHRDFIVPRRLSNGLYIETHYGTKDCEDYARRLLEMYRYRGDILEVK